MSSDSKRNSRKTINWNLDAYRQTMMQLPSCMAAPQVISAQNGQIYDMFLLDLSPTKRIQKNPANLIAAFLRLNQEMLKFLDIQVSWEGTGPKTRMQVFTQRYVGAIPTVLPDGGPGGDIFVYPQHMQHGEASKDEAMAQLTNVLMLLDGQVSPEFGVSPPLKNAMDLQAPLYYEAIKFLELYETAIKERWHKFRVENREYAYPKGATNWTKYAQRYADPNNRLRFPTRDNALTVDHPEWRELKYVFELAKEELSSYNTPQKLRNEYEAQLQNLEKKVRDIRAQKPHRIVIHASDPIVIKKLKEQAIVLLERRTDTCTAWRIDVAKVFELFAQLVLQRAVERCGLGGVHCNAKFGGQGNIPAWGLRYLEPDMVIATKELLLVADAKYKANMFHFGNPSSVLKDEHRHDLHQLLAYCAFAPHKNKLAMLMYPADSVKVREIAYQSNFHGVHNAVLLVGIPFSADNLDQTVKEVCEKVVQPSLLKFIEENTEATNV